MIFQYGNSADSSKTLSYSDNVSYVMKKNIVNPWFDQGENITTVSFDCNFAPNNMSYWFSDSYVTNVYVNLLDTSKLISMCNTFSDCDRLVGSAFCGSNVTNMIFATQEAKKRAPYNGGITMWAVNCMLNIYEYYIECVGRAPEHAPNNLKWCQRYYDEVYKGLEENISNEILAQHYNDVMRNAYIGDKLNGIIPCMSIFEFLDKLRNSSERSEI